MNVLILGSGGREHALADAVSKSKLLTSLVCIPGNPGMEKIAKCIDIDPYNNDLIKEFCAKENIDLIIPGSESFLENGITDIFKDTKVLVFGPTKEAAKIETSKEYAKDLMKKYNIPTAKYEVFNDLNKAKAYVIEQGVPIVIKYDGLAAGKGVVVCTHLEEAFDALHDMLEDKTFGESTVVIEECLEGPEFSFMTFVHEGMVIPMPIAQDHKRLLDQDLGPNTGGMGIYSPVPIISSEIVEFSFKEIMQKTVDAMIQENNSFTGFLYGGLMVTVDGPKVIEFNCRFGDPETEVILPKLQTDILEVIIELFEGNQIQVSWSDDFIVGVVMASKGYPKTYQKGFDIEGLHDNLYHMGTKREGNKIVTNGGRVLLVLGRGESLELAQKNAYNNVKKIKCNNLIYRKDIGYKSLKG